MPGQHIFQDYMNYATGQINLQEYIDRLCNQADNNQIVEFLYKFVNSCNGIDLYFDISNQEKSPYFPIHAINGQVYYYYVRKIPALNHYCIYIVVPDGHLLNEGDYDDIPGATYCSRDSEDPSRWVFGWDYAHFEYCTPGDLHLLVSYSPEELLAKKIVSVDLLMNDIHSKIDYFCSI